MARSVAALGLGLLWLIPVGARAQIGDCTPDESDPVVVEIETALGSIPLALFPNTAPETVANFLAYANAGDYDGTFLHRVIPGFIIQERRDRAAERRVSERGTRRGELRPRERECIPSADPDEL